MRTVKMSTAEWARCVRVFRKYGCDPYNSSDDVSTFQHVMNWRIYK